MSAPRMAAGLIAFRVVPDEIKDAGSGDTPKIRIEYLFLQKQAIYRRHNWGPPKGYANSGESDKSTALRKTQEKTGLTEKDLSILNEFEAVLIYNARRGRKRVRLWPARLIDANTSITISAVSNCYRWAPIHEVIELAFWDDMKQELTRCDTFLRNMYGTI